MAGRPAEERLNDINQRIRDLQERKKALQSQVSAQARKARTRELIQIGGIMARLGVDSLEKAQRLQQWLEGNPRRLETIRAVAEGTGLDGILATGQPGPGAPAPGEG